MLLELANNYVDIINRGDLPNYELTYKHMMRFQLHKMFQNFMGECEATVQVNSKKMMSKEAIDKIEKQLLV